LNLELGASLAAQQLIHLTQYFKTHVREIHILGTSFQMVKYEFASDVMYNSDYPKNRSNNSTTATHSTIIFAFT